MKKFFCLFFPISLFFFAGNPGRLVAQTGVRSGISAEAAVREVFLKGGVRIENIRFGGQAEQLGIFRTDEEQSVISFPAGLILSTGRSGSFFGPNFGEKDGADHSSPGDDALSRLAGDSTFDAAVLEFDFIPGGSHVIFNYIFGSEEYLEYVNSAFNDVFAFYVSPADGSRPPINIALVPGTDEPVSINTINHFKSTFLYKNNPKVDTLEIDPICFKNNGQIRRKYLKKGLRFVKIPPERRLFTPLSAAVSFDGITARLSAEFEAVPFKKYHIKMVIADVHDGLLDSGVLLEAGSFLSFEEVGIPADTVQLKTEESEPLLQADLPAPRSIKPQKYQVFFDFDSDRPGKAGRLVLEDVFRQIKANKKLKISVLAHTDSRGSDTYNLALSSRRLESVLQFLEEKGALPLAGRRAEGESRPVADNSTDSGRQLNRRVELLLFVE